MNENDEKINIEVYETFDSERVNNDIFELCKDVQEEIDNENYDILMIDGKIVDSEIKVFTQKNEKNYLEALNYIGILKYKNNLITISDRLDCNNNGMNVLNYMFENVYKITGRFFKEKNQDSEFTNDEIDTLENKIYSFNKSLIAGVFVNALSNAFSKGTFRQYIEREKNDSKVQGRIDIARHISQNQLVQGRVAYTTREYTFDNEVNKLILKTYHALELSTGNAIKKFMQSQYDTHKYIDKLKAEYPNISEVTSDTLIKNASHKIANPVYRNYEVLRKICIQILKSKCNYVFDERLRSVNGILVNMGQIWREYITNSVLYKSGIENLKEFDSEYIQSKITGKKIKNNFVIKCGKKLVTVNVRYSKSWEDTYCDNENDDTNQKIECELDELKSLNDLVGTNRGVVIFPLPVVGDYNENIEKFYSINSSCIEEIDLENHTIYEIPFIIPNDILDYVEFKNAIRKIESKFIETLKLILHE